MSSLRRSIFRLGDAGFTLTELLITMVIIGVITVPVADLMISYFTNSNTTLSRLNESHDEQIATAYFSEDVSSMGTRSATAPYGAAQSVWTSFPPGSCGSGGGGTQLVLIKWNDSTWDPASQTQTTAVDSAAYYIRTVRTESQLHRVFCRDGAQVSDATLAHNVDTAAVNQATCSTTCTSATLPATVTLQLGIRDPTGKGQPYTMRLTGQRRQT